MPGGAGQGYKGDPAAVPGEGGADMSDTGQGKTGAQAAAVAAFGLIVDLYGAAAFRAVSGAFSEAETAAITAEIARRWAAAGAEGGK